MQANLWSRGGLSWRDLIWRTALESWEDEVFGQAARLSFYFFLALFPSLVLLLLLLGKLAGTGTALRQQLLGSFHEILPGQASDLVAKTLSELNRAGGSRWFAVLACVWSALNGTWVLMAGLNKAYEVNEERPWWRIAITAAGLTFALALLGIAALLLILYGSRIGHAAGNSAGIHAGFGLFWRVVHWPVVAALLLVAFAVVYRFGPNLDDVKLQWSTPGAVMAVVLWLMLTIGFREYVNRFNSYPEIYGPLAAVAILLLWFYLTSAVILIGGEMNSEIEKAAAQSTHRDGRVPGQRRRAGNRT